jgi:uncharacterized protein YukE
VNAPGLDGLYNHFVREAGDATDALAYTRRHCDLDWDAEGLLMMLMGPHKHTYESVTTALTKLHELTQSAGTQVNRAQLDYARTDDAAAARVDSTYAGAKNPTALYGTLTRGRPDLQTQVTDFSDVTEPTARLRNPEYIVGIEMWDINPLADLLSPAAWARQVCIWVFGWDPLEAWSQQLGGNWKAYTHCAVALGAVGSAAHDVGRNLTSGAAAVSTVWRGNAAEAEQEFHLALGAAAMELKSACTQYCDLYTQAADATKKLADVVAGLISDLLDVLIIINVAAAAGTALIETGIGAIAGYGVAAYYTWQAYELYNEISKFYGDAEALIKAIGGTITSVKAQLAVKDLPTVQPYHHPAGY